MTDRTLDCFDYVNQPYPRVRDALLANAHAVFQNATAAAAAHAATLHVRIGAIDLATDVTIQVEGIEHDYAYDRPATKLTLGWRAANNPRMFPSMKATLVVFALSATETQLELRGTYQPPMGKLGEVIDAAAGHRLAEASVTRLLREIAGWLREELAGASPTSDARPTRDDLAVPSPRPVRDARPEAQPVFDPEC